MLVQEKCLMLIRFLAVCSLLVLDDSYDEVPGRAESKLSFNSETFCEKPADASIAIVVKSINVIIKFHAKAKIITLQQQLVLHFQQLLR